MKTFAQSPANCREQAIALVEECHLAFLRLRRLASKSVAPRLPKRHSPDTAVASY